MERGESFGEMGLLESARRTATVRAIDDAEVFEVDKGTFDRLLPCRNEDHGDDAYSGGSHYQPARPGVRNGYLRAMR